ncbi:MAG: hypothetical protein RBJ76_29175 [Stenomitos frigidus ULC029]
MTALSHYFSLHRRYHRSVNLERDFDNPEAVEGYVLTERSLEALQRMLAAFDNPKAQRAWTLIGVYGTGKSAFANYLTALCAPEKSKAAEQAWYVTEQALPKDSPLLEQILETLPTEGLLRCVAVGQREPLSWTVMRALANGCQEFWSRKQKPDWFETLTDWGAEVAVGRCQITNQQVLTLLEQVTQAAKTQVLLVLDELGKNLEYAVNHGGTEDLYLLQQIAELRYKGKYQVHFVGLLHQSFAGYSERLSAIEQNEWTKIQGRFETMQFTESASQMTRLIGQAIERLDSEASDRLASVCDQTAKVWFKALKPVLVNQGIAEKDISAAYPLHPVTALALPLLCTRYAQNDRSLFTFLTSHEPHGLTEFLAARTFDGELVPTLQLHQLYDYFVEAATGLASRMNLQRWVEIQGLIQEAQTQNEAVLKVLKTIGILNLITATGTLKAAPALVAFALCDHPDDAAALKRWQAVIKDLTQKGIITYRNQTDDLKLWEGSDFNVEAAIYQLIEKERLPLAQLLTRARPLQPIVAQRHYTTTGNLRYFEQQYADSLTPLAALRCHAPSTDGLIVYWLDRQFPEEPPAHTVEGKPLVVITTTQLDLLRTRAQQLQALKTIHKEATALQTDGVARREVKHRLVDAERLLDDTLQQAFNWSVGQNHCWIAGEATTVLKTRAFQALLSDLCDRTYHLGLRLDNEFINRRELTSQGAKARRELIEAMLKHSRQERLGLEGYGPEVAMYYSVLAATGIHRQNEAEWDFQPPHPEAGVITVWQAIEQFCQAATKEQRSLNLLYEQLEQPPYGVKPGAIPLLLAAFLLYHVDDVGIYKDGTFIPILGPEHFELLVKAPSRFSVKYFEMVGLRSQVFRELETVLKSPNAKAPAGLRNASLLAIAKPLFGFVRQLPEFTRSTKRLNKATLKVLQALQTAQEPDELLFVSLPAACGFNLMTAGEEENEQAAKAFRKQLVQCLHEIQTAYDNLLSDCQKHLYEAFGVHSKEANLREDLRVRASYLVGQCIDPILKHFVAKAVEEDSSDKDWLEALVRIVADKHPKGWVDEDFSRFEIALSDLVRRFQNLEALRSEIRRQGKGFDALRITVTEPNGQEVHEVVWIDEEHEELFDRLIEEALSTPALKDNPRLQKGFLAKLNAKLFSRKPDDALSELGQSKHKRGQSA